MIGKDSKAKDGEKESKESPNGLEPENCEGAVVKMDEYNAAWNKKTRTPKKNKDSFTMDLIKPFPDFEIVENPQFEIKPTKYISEHLALNLSPVLEKLALRLYHAETAKGHEKSLNEIKWVLLLKTAEFDYLFVQDKDNPTPEEIRKTNEFAGAFLTWEYDNRDEISRYRNNELQNLRSPEKGLREKEIDNQITRFFFDYFQEKKTIPDVSDFRRYFKRQVGLLPAPKSLGYLVHSSENEAVNRFFSFGWGGNNQPKTYEIRATRSKGKYLPKTHVTLTPHFKSAPPVIANLVFFHAVEIGRNNRLDSDNKDDPGQHYFTIESVVKALTGTKRNGENLRKLAIYQEVVDALKWLKENLHSIDASHFIDTRCRDKNRIRNYVGTPILDWNIDPEARIDGSLAEIYYFDRVPPLFWMTDELGRLRRIKAAQFMPEGNKAPYKDGAFLALFDAAFEAVCRQAYLIHNGQTKTREVPVYLHDDPPNKRQGVFCAAGMPLPEKCTEKAYRSNKDKLIKIFERWIEIGILSAHKPIKEGRKVIGYMLTVKDESLIFGEESKRVAAQISA